MPPSPFQPVSWVRGTLGTTNLTTDSSGALTKSAGGSTAWNAGAVASPRIARDGSVIFTAAAGGTCDFVIGLNLIDSSELNSDIDHAIRLKTDNKAQVYHGATAGVDLGIYSASTLFTIRRSGAQVQFLKDGQLMHTSTTSSAGTVFVDCSFYKQGSKLTSCQVDDGDLDDDGLPDSWELASLPGDAGWADVMAFLPQGNLDGPPRPASIDSATNRQEFEDGSLAGNPLSFLEPVIWQFHAGTQSTGTDGGLQKNTTTTVFDADAVSAKKILEDGKLAFKVAAPAAMAVGLNASNDSRADADLDWAFILAADGTFDVQRLPDSATDLNVTGPLGSYTAESVFAIERVSGRVNFLRDGVLVYSSTNASSGPLFADCSFKTATGQISSARLYTGDLDNDSLPDSWELSYLAAGADMTDLAAFDPDADPDSDGMNSLDEYFAGTHPLQALLSPAAVEWYSTTYVAPVAGSQGGAVKTGSTGWTNADALAGRTIYQTGRLTFRVKSGSALAVGFTSTDNNRSYTDQEYSIQFTAAGQASVYEGTGTTSATLKASLGAYDSTTHFAIRRVAGQIEFLKNNIVYHTAAVPVSTPLIVDAAFYTAGSEIHSAFLYTGDLDEDLMPDDWEISNYKRKHGHNPTFAQLRDGFTPTGDEDGDGFGNREEYFCGTDPLEQLIKPEVVDWQNLTATLVVPGSRGGLRKTSATAGYNADASSRQQMTGNGVLLFTAPPTGILAVGLTETDNNNANTDLEYAYALTTTGAAIHKNGTVVVASVGTYTESTLFGIRRTGSVVEFLRDGVVMHVSDLPSSAPLIADCSLSTVYTTANNHRIASALFYHPDADLDQDGLPDAWELQTGLLSLNATLQDLTQLSSPGSDSDGDGLTLAQEYAAGTSPNSADTDGDGLPDGWEVSHGLAVNDPTNATMDTDSDGLNNLAEFLAGTSPVNPDSDADQMPDGYEVAHSLLPLDPTDADSDKDGDLVPNLWEYTRFKPGTNPPARYSASDSSETPLPDAVVDVSLGADMPNATPKKFKGLHSAYQSLPAGSIRPGLIFITPGVYEGISYPFESGWDYPVNNVALIAASGASRTSWTEGVVIKKPDWNISADWLFNGLIFTEGGNDGMRVSPAFSTGTIPRVRLVNCLFRDVRLYRNLRESSEPAPADLGHDGGALTNLGGAVTLEQCTFFRSNSTKIEGSYVTGIASVANLAGSLKMRNCMVWDDHFPAGVPREGGSYGALVEGWPLQPPVTGVTLVFEGNLIQGGMAQSLDADPKLMFKGYPTSESQACVHAGVPTQHSRDLQGQPRSLNTPGIGAVEWINSDSATASDHLPDWWETWWFQHLLTNDEDVTNPFDWRTFPPLTVSRPTTAIQHYLDFTDPISSYDGDQLHDNWERAYFGNLAQTDTDNPDGDARNNLQEQEEGTNPTRIDGDFDSDDDGLPDNWERDYFTMAPQPPLATPDPLRYDSDDDPDEDGWSNQEEMWRGTAPNMADAAKDSEPDGLPDEWEWANFKTQTYVSSQTAETDYDCDGINNLAEYLAGTNPAERPYTMDKNNNRLWDWWEKERLGGLTADTSAWSLDPDGDGRSNEREMLEGTDPFSPNLSQTRQGYHNFSFAETVPQSEDDVKVGFDSHFRKDVVATFSWFMGVGGTHFKDYGPESWFGEYAPHSMAEVFYSSGNNYSYGWYIYDFMPSQIDYDVVQESQIESNGRMRTQDGKPADRLIVRALRKTLEKRTEVFCIWPGQTHANGASIIMRAPHRYLKRVDWRSEKAQEGLEEMPLHIPRSVPPNDLAGPRYRKIGLNGSPIPDSPPSAEGEESALPEETFVDSYNRQLRHSTSDIWAKSSSTDIPIQVRRDYAADAWSWRSGLRPDERPDRPFGPCWTSNLTPHVRLELNTNTTPRWIEWFYHVWMQNGQYVVRSGPLEPDHWDQRRYDKLRNPPRITLTDERGAAYSFTDLGLDWDFVPLNPVERGFKARWVASPDERHDSKTAFDTLEQWPAGVASAAINFVLTKRNGTKCYYSRCDLVQSFPQDRVRPTGMKTDYYYFRLDRVETVQGNQINYSYDYDNNPGTLDEPSLIPATISDPHRPDCKLAITQDKGRVVSITGPSGEVVHYGYSAQSGVLNLNDLSTKMDNMGSGSENKYPVLVSVWRGSTPDPSPPEVLQEVKYSYSYEYEIDPTPDLTQPGVQTYGHLEIAGITDERGATHEFRYALNQTTAYEGWNGAFYFTRKQVGLPRLLTRIQRPDHTTAQPSLIEFSGTRDVLLKYDKSVTGGINTVVNGPCGQYTYAFHGAHVTRPQELTNFFNGWQDNYPDGDINEGVVYLSFTKMDLTSAAGTEYFTFEPSAGMALKSVTDLSGNTTTYKYQDAYQPPDGFVQSLGVQYYDDPTEETSPLAGQPKDPLELLPNVSGNFKGVKTYKYHPVFRTRTETTDEAGIKSVSTLNDLGLCTQEDVVDTRGTPSTGDDVLLRRVNYSFVHPTQPTNPDYARFKSFLYRKTLTTSGFVAPTAQAANPSGWAMSLPPLGSLSDAYVPPAGAPPPCVDLVTDYLPDENGRVEQEIQYVGPGLTHPMTTTTQYTGGGEKLTVTNPRGCTTRFSYQGQTRRLLLTEFLSNPELDGGEAAAFFKELHYDAHGNVIREMDENGVRTFHEYDVFNRRTRSTVDLNGNGVPDPSYSPQNVVLPAADNPVSSPSYDGDLVTTTTYNAFNLPVTLTDPRGVVTLQEYDDIGRLVRTTVNATGPQDQRQVTRYADDNPATLDFVGGSVFDTKGFKPVRVLDPRGFETTFTYDKAYRVIAKQFADMSYPVTAGARSITTFTCFDEAGNAAYVVDPLGRVTYTVFDGLRQPVQVYPPYEADNASCTQNHYTPAGQLWRSVELYLVNGVWSSSEKLTFHDAAGRPTHAYASSVEVWDGATESLVTRRPLAVTQYDDAGNPTHVTDSLGRTTQTFYDSRNRPWKVMAPEVANVVSPTGAATFVAPITLTFHDAVGRTVEVRDPLGAVTLTRHDRAGRVWRVVAPVTGTAPNLQHHVTTHLLDPGGNILQVIDARGKSLTNQYDGLGRLVHTVDPEGVENDFAYDLAGNRTDVWDGLGQRTRFYYDGQNRLIKQVFANQDTQLFQYDALRKVAQVDCLNRTTSFDYDARDRLVEVVSPDLRRLLAYDGAGRLLSVAEDNHPQAAVTMTYNALGWLMTESSCGLTHIYTYDLAGSRVRAAFGTGRTAHTTYDNLSRPLSIRDDAATPGLGTDDRVTLYGYDLAGRAVRLLQPNGNLCWNVHDELGRLKSRALYVDAGAAVEVTRLEWYHDALGNVVSHDEQWPVSSHRPQGWRRTNMSYDDASRLTEEVVSESAGELTRTTYGYDDASNRASKAVQGGAEPGFWGYHYNESNQLRTWEKRLLEEGPVQKNGVLHYDSNGNRTNQGIQDAGSGAQVTSYAWDAQNRLKQVTMPDGVVHGYRYDHRTRRIGITKTGGGQAEQGTTVVFSGGLSLAEWEVASASLPTQIASPGVPTVEYSRGPDMGGGVGGLLYSRRGTTLKYNLSNGRGDIVAQTDGGGSLTWTASYEAYGKRTKETGENADKQRANTKDEDPTGLLNEGFRYRDLETGVWLSRDPAGFVDGPNLYAYVKQNPWTSFDPDGLALDTIWDIGNVIHDVGRIVKNGAEIAWGAAATGYHKATGNSAAADASWNGAGGDWSEFKQAAGDTALDAGAMCVPFVPAGAQKVVRGGINAYDKIERAEAGVNAVEKASEGDIVGALNDAASAAGTLPGGKKARGGSPTASASKTHSDNNSQTGSYTNTHASGMTYDGKGDKQRSQASGKRVEAETGDQHIATDWTPAPNNREAFKQESRRLDSHDGPKSETNHNKIESPGKKMRTEDGD
jgi:RHS repeat-associated protein